jgi:hypothetical protein
MGMIVAANSLISTGDIVADVTLPILAKKCELMIFQHLKPHSKIPFFQSSKQLPKRKYTPLMQYSAQKTEPFKIVE